MTLTLDEIFREWDVDSKVDDLDLGGAALNIPKLHSKYIRLLSAENQETRKLESRLKQLMHLKTEYYSGNLNGTEQLKKLEWEPYSRRLLNNLVPQFVEADPQVIKLTETVGDGKEKVSVLSSIIKEVSAMSFNIRAGIEWRKFVEGS